MSYKIFWYSYLLYQSIKKKNYKDLLNEQDDDGCTVIHYVARLGFVEFLKVNAKFKYSKIMIQG